MILSNKRRSFWGVLQSTWSWYFEGRGSADSHGPTENSVELSQLQLTGFKMSALVALQKVVLTLWGDVLSYVDPQFSDIG
jgi:hypothetical protein